MARIEKSALVNYPPEKIYALVDDVETYPEFLPWCDGIEVHSKDENITHATIKIRYQQLHNSFTTLNTKQKPHSIKMELTEGPFKYLNGAWRFTALGDAGCKIEFFLEYEFASKMFSLLAGSAFNKMIGSFVDAFIDRAKQVYGTNE